MSELVTYRLEEGVATIAMDDGKANALSPTMLSQLNAALDRAAADRAIVILTGRPGMFSAGFDLSVITARGSNAVTMIRQGFELAERLLSYPAPLIVACSGHALAMGVFLVLTGDYCVGADGAYKIGANEVAIGLPMPRAAIEICRQRLAPAHLNRALITSEIYTPDAAVAAGFLDRVVTGSELQDEARAAAARFARLDRNALAATKRLAREPTLKALGGAIEEDAVTFRTLMGVP
ncbi:MAG: crotonase/enoyl-CoA hydratase family protein [Nevskia sp.]|nr:crotonase/enoyl-CoA hydratase family protein [Nevskia sp.]